MSFLFADTCTLVNRAPWPVAVRFDGRDVIAKPGENQGFPKIAVHYAKNQNPLMGSEDPYDPTAAQYLVGVKENPRDNCEPLTEEEINQHLTKPQRINRDLMADQRGDLKSREVIRGRKQHPAFEARFAMGADGDELTGSNAA